GILQPEGRQRVGCVDQRAAAERLLRERAARRHGGGFAGQVRDLLRDDWRAGVRLARFRRYVVADRARSAGGVVGGSADAGMIKVVLPPHLRTLAGVRGDVELEVRAPITQRAVLDALEAAYPMLCGTIRDHVTRQRRPFLRY